jgi:hypothetical protein
MQGIGLIQINRMYMLAYLGRKDSIVSAHIFMVAFNRNTGSQQQQLYKSKQGFFGATSVSVGCTLPGRKTSRLTTVQQPNYIYLVSELLAPV